MRCAVLLLCALTAACKPDLTPVAGGDAAGETDLLPIIRQAAETSGCAGHSWRDRGVGAQPFFTGMGLAFAKALCQPQTALSREIDRPAGPASTDALTALSGRVAALDTGDSAHPALVRLFTVATGLAQRESNGRYCVGRDRSADFTAADSAEAGLFQTSWGAHRSSPVLEPLFRAWQDDPSGCELDLFRSPMPRCSAGDAETFGSGPGAEWQDLTKSCPMFAVEYGLVVLRRNGGSAGEFGPIRRDEVEVLQACTDFFVAVEGAVSRTPSLCDRFR